MIIYDLTKLSNFCGDFITIFHYDTFIENQGFSTFRIFNIKLYLCNLMSAGTNNEYLNNIDNLTRQINESTPKTKKKKFTYDEDLQLINFVKKFGVKKWSVVSQLLKGRTARQCRERWFKYLSPNVSKDNWQPSEDKILLDIVANQGTKWSLISKVFPCRSESEIKNRCTFLINDRLYHAQHNFVFKYNSSNQQNTLPSKFFTLQIFPNGQKGISPNEQILNNTKEIENMSSSITLPFDDSNMRTVAPTMAIESSESSIPCSCLTNNKINELCNGLRADPIEEKNIMFDEKILSVFNHLNKENEIKKISDEAQSNTPHSNNFESIANLIKKENEDETEFEYMTLNVPLLGETLVDW
ncbi:hypothetical protein TRFO_25626 [Tritrichomonas foetus]|uniref:Myb-like DNA-binding domain containing protein n=1 Tax=Tritrichomonas foetus TaxID=1144522 RepID=A0A1J4K5M8_9EUKA|nr:hypothetical protein TRFO_25626 [Tritrichomonas foetus]|eukprot:OHT06298.1 hypothetical protein TRFO_25626 [Tritrichomonas foetus]